ncbi:MAG: hypothetical protein KatS3mg095_0375 [Candidatus Parcubacteria bacterium]|nr:MAG: hypothetical protein KatS3mg095_0375 [Candidatus Parcubacteria bacterium]
MKQFDFLREKAKKFYQQALKLFEEKEFDLSVFNLEQSCQLFLKYLIGKKIGDWPKTHFLYELMEELIKIYKNEKIEKFYKENELFFDDLSDAYFTSRYFPKEFSENLVKNLFNKTKEFYQLIEEELNEKLNNE